MRAAYKSQVFAADTAANELATDIAPGSTILYQWDYVWILTLPGGHEPFSRNLFLLLD
jgi:hypothetical protein